jgi:hypothetical protein
VVSVVEGAIDVLGEMELVSVDHGFEGDFKLWWVGLDSESKSGEGFESVLILVVEDVGWDL